MIPDETLQLLRTLYRDQREGYLTLTAIHPARKDRAPSRHLDICDKDAIHPGTFGVCLGRHGTLNLRDLCRALHLDSAEYGGVYSAVGRP